MWSDVLQAARSWLRVPRLTLTLLACIAIAIGGTATVLTILHGILLAPFPYPEAGRLVDVWTLEERAGSRPNFSHPDFEVLRERNRSFAALVGVTTSRLLVVTRDGGERLRGEIVSPGYFELLGVSAQLGRVFSRDDEAGRGDRVILLSDRIWRTRFGADAAAVGTTVRTADGPFVIAGVLPPLFLGVNEEEGGDYWISDGHHPSPRQRDDRRVQRTRALGLLNPGVSVAEARAEMRALTADLARAYPETDKGLGARVEPMGENWRSPLRGGLYTMLVGSAFLLLVGCANVALLLLARLVTRERELAIRLSLGAGRRELIRLMLVESLLLAAVGGGLGLLLASWASALFVKTSGLVPTPHFTVGLGPVPALVCGAVVIVTGLLFGLLPAFAALRLDAAQAMRTGGRGLAGSALQGRAGNRLVVAQTALAVVLLTGASLFLRSYGVLRRTDLGYRTSGLLRLQVSLLGEGYRTPEALEAFFLNLEGDLGAVSGVRGFGALSPTLPPYNGLDSYIRLKGGDLGTPDGSLDVNVHFATRDVLDLLRIPLREGRHFGLEDRRGAPAVAVVSASLSRRLGGGKSGLGRTLLLQSGTEVLVAGVVDDTLWDGLRERSASRLDLYLSLAQFPQTSVGFLFDYTAPPRTLTASLRKAVLARDPTASLHWIDTVEEALDNQTVQDRFWATLSSTFAGTAFLLAVVGLYGLLSYGVGRRAQEIGVRMALGASGPVIARMIVGQGMRLVASGLVAGVVLSFLLGRLLEAHLFGIRATDLVAHGRAIGLLLAVALVAAWLPARRAGRVNPMSALRAE